MSKQVETGLPGREFPGTASRIDGRGFTVLELVISLCLLGLILQGGWSVFSSLRKAAEAAEAQAQELETVRTVGWVLSAELAGATANLDWWPGRRDTLGIRAYRGLALFRGRDPEGEVSVCYTGVRLPDPEKDSLLVLGIGGTWRSVDLLKRTGGGSGCWDGNRGRNETWTVEEDESPDPWLLARVFERGSYHLVDGALRYRRGAGGRQPLTPANLEIGRFVLGPGLLPDLSWQLTLVGPEGVSLSTWRGSIR